MLQKASNENKLDEQVQAILDALDFSGWTILANGITQHIKDAAGEGAATTLLALGLDETDDADVFDVVNEAALTFATNRGAELVGMKIGEDGALVANPDAEWAITDGTRELLRATIRDAIKNGTSTEDLRQQIGDSFAFSPSRALNIARTETARAFGQGSLRSAKESGVVDGKEWDLSSDHDHDDECDENAGAGVIALDDDFPSGDSAEPAHPNCSCSTRFIVSDQPAD